MDRPNSHSELKTGRGLDLAQKVEYQHVSRRARCSVRIRVNGLALDGAWSRWYLWSSCTYGWEVKGEERAVRGKLVSSNWRSAVCTTLRRPHSFQVREALRTKAFAETYCSLQNRLGQKQARCSLEGNEGCMLSCCRVSGDPQMASRMSGAYDHMHASQTHLLLPSDSRSSEEDRP